MQPETESSIMLRSPPSFGDDFVARMIAFFEDALGVRPVPRDEEDIDYDQADGQFILRFEKPVSQPTESDIDIIEQHVAARGWTFHWPVDDDDVLEVSLTINDMQTQTNKYIKDRKK